MTGSHSWFVPASSSHVWWCSEAWGGHAQPPNVWAQPPGSFCSTTPPPLWISLYMDFGISGGLEQLLNGSRGPTVVRIILIQKIFQLITTYLIGLLAATCCASCNSGISLIPPNECCVGRPGGKWQPHSPSSPTWYSKNFTVMSVQVFWRGSHPTKVFVCLTHIFRFCFLLNMNDVTGLIFWGRGVFSISFCSSLHEHVH